jgi:hypothetical protein
MPDLSFHDNGTPADDEGLNDQTRKRQLHLRWTVAVRLYVAGDLFRYVQFINRDRDIEFGSNIQKIVCKECNIAELEQMEYWSACGIDEVLLVLRRKRQAVSTSMKARFGSEYNYREISVLTSRQLWYTNKRSMSHHNLYQSLCGQRPRNH